jgi:AcrR family transcriptional regulator
VVDEAVRIADSEGLAALTLARVATALGVQAPSLYNHVSGHQGLVRLIALRGLRGLSDAMRSASVGRAGNDALSAAARAYRDYVRAHPGCYEATVRAPDPGDVELAAAAVDAVAVMLAVLTAWDLECERAVHAVRVIRSALHGFATIEAGGGFGLPLDVDKSFELLIETLLAGLKGAPDRNATHD